jgi:hypothetical protein
VMGLDPIGRNAIAIDLAIVSSGAFIYLLSVIRNREES